MVGAGQEGYGAMAATEPCVRKFVRSGSLAMIAGLPGVH
jgi:hypothetical protein